MAPTVVGGYAEFEVRRNLAAVSGERRDMGAFWLYKRCRMKDLTDPRWIKLKGILFLVVGVLSAVLLLADNPSFKAGLLFGISIWCFCRFYYFAFYVIEKYVDPSYRFSGLWSFVGYLLRRKKN